MSRNGTATSWYRRAWGISMPLEAREQTTLMPYPVGRLPEKSITEPPGFFGGFVSSLDEAFQLENTVGSSARRIADGPLGDRTIDYDYNPMDDPDIRPFLQNTDEARRFIYAENREQALDIKTRIEEERDMRAEVEAAGAGGYLAYFAAGLLDPMILVPVGGQLAKGAQGAKLSAKVLDGSLKTAKAGFVASTATEAILQATQESRTVEESLWNVGGATFLSGILGGAWPVVKDYTGRTIDDVGGSVIRELNGGGSVSAAATPTTTLKQEGLKSALGFEKLSQNFTPYERLIASTSISSRRAVQDLVRSPLILQKNLDDIASPIPVEEHIDFWNVNRAQTKQFFDEQFVEYRTGMAGGRMKAAIIGTGDALGQSGGKMTYKQFREAVWDAAINNDRHAVPEVAAAAKSLRDNIFDPILNKGIDLGYWPEELATQPPKTAASYISRAWDTQKISARYNDFKDIVTKFLRSERDAAGRQLAKLQDDIEAAAEGADIDKMKADIDDLKYRASFLDEELPDIADQIIQYRILATKEGALPYAHMDDVPGRLGTKGKHGRPGVFRPRSFMIPDEMVRDFVIKDPFVLMDRYVHRTIPELMLAEKFGDANMSKVLQDIADDYAKLKAATTSQKKLQKLERQRERDIADVVALRDRLRGVYGLPDDPTSPLVRAGQVARQLNLLSKLSDLLTSQLPDIARPVMTQGMTNTLRHGLVPLIRNFKTARLSQKDAGRMASVFETILNTRLSRRGDVTDFYAGETKLERGLKGMTDTFGLISLSAPMNQMMKEFTATIARSRIIEESIKWKKGTISAKSRALLNSSYISKDIAFKLADMGEQVNGTWFIKDDALEDLEVMTALRAALQREVNSTIVTPGKGQTPLWMSKPMGQVLGQFRSYMFAANQSVMLSGLQRMDAAQFSGLVLSISLGAMVYALKTQSAGKEVSDDPQTWVAEGFDRAGVAPLLFEANNTLEKISGSTVGVRPMLGAEASSRFASRNQWGTLFGPSVGLIADTWKLGGAVTSGDWQASDTHAVRRMIPYQNFFLLRGLMKKAEEGVNNALGAQ